MMYNENGQFKHTGIFLALKKNWKHDIFRKMFNWKLLSKQINTQKEQYLVFSHTQVSDFDFYICLKEHWQVHICRYVHVDDGVAITCCCSDLDTDARVLASYPKLLHSTCVDLLELTCKRTPYLDVHHRHTYFKTISTVVELLLVSCFLCTFAWVHLTNFLCNSALLKSQ